MASNNQIPDCGKTVGPIAFPEGTIGSFHNSVIDNFDNVIVFHGKMNMVKRNIV